jgi:hypothetical protein
MTLASTHLGGVPGSIGRLLATFALASTWIAVPGTGATAIANTCQARNATKDGPSRSDLQRVIDAASPGDTIEVRNVCVGNFVIAKDLTIIGRSTTTVPRPVLDGHAQNSVLTVDATVTVANLAIMHGAKPPGTGDSGGGIATSGMLTLRNVVVRANRGEGGGIYNAGTLTLNGSTSVRHNYAGGILNDGMLTMNDTSSVTENRWRSAIYGVGDVTMNDASTVARHRHFAGITTEGTITLNDAASVRDNDDFYGIWLYAGGELVMNASSSVAHNAGGIANEGTVTLNDSASVRGNHVSRRGGGVFNGTGSVLVMNGSSIIRGNTAVTAGGGIFNLGTATLNGSAIVRGNRSNGPGGGITNKLTLTLNDNAVIARNEARTNGGGNSSRNSGSVSLNASPSVHNNTADADDDGNGVGGGILCDTGSLTGAVDGGNVNDNHRGTAPPVEDNIVTRSC